jgi:hypothetical protein
MKTLLLLLFAPGYDAQMPPDDDKTYIAGAYVYSPWYKQWPVERTVTGRRKAYKAARWEALMLDWSTVSRMCGVDWYLKEVKENHNVIH